MPKATQLNLVVPDDVGMLARVCRDLATHGINVLALTAQGGTDGKGGAGGQGDVRVLVANRELAEAALARAGYRFSAEDVIFVELKNRPGALAKLVEKLGRANIDIRYAFATAYTKAQKTAAVIAVKDADLPRALKLLGS